MTLTDEATQVRHQYGHKYSDFGIGSIYDIILFNFVVLTPAEYLFPNDEQAKECQGLTHCYPNLVLGGKLFLAPTSVSGGRVLNIGS